MERIKFSRFNMIGRSAAMLLLAGAGLWMTTHQHALWLPPLVMLMSLAIALPAEVAAPVEVEDDFASSERNKSVNPNPALSTSLLNNLTEGVVLVNNSGQVTYANDAARRMHGVDILRAPLDAATHPYRLLTAARRPYALLDTPIYRALRGERVRGEQWRIRHENGREVLVEGNAMPIFERDGTPQGVMLTLRDITARHELAEKLKQSENTKERVLMLLGHELRTPLTPMLGWISVLRNNPEKTPELLPKALVSMEHSAQNLHRVIGHLLDAAGLVCGSIQLNRTEHDINTLLGEAVQNEQASATARGILIRTNFEAGLPGLQLDQERFLPALQHIVANAIKFSTPGTTVKISSHLHAGGDSAPEAVVLEITDQGEGIASNTLPYIYGFFSQADSSSTRQHDGLGIGLGISKAIVELHGGTINAESAGQGQGTRFIVTLPVKSS